jgi:hypothetical protein
MFDYLGSIFSKDTSTTTTSNSNSYSTKSSKGKICFESITNILEKEKKEFKKEEEEKTETLDLCFLMDSTGSMGSWIQKTKANIIQIVDDMKKECPNQILRLGMVAYRDYEDDVLIEYFNFSKDYDAFKKFVSGLTATGGGDAPE